jgi:hypothetical protein
MITTKRRKNLLKIPKKENNLKNILRICKIQFPHQEKVSLKSR